MQVRRQHSPQALEAGRIPAQSEPSQSGALPKLEIGDIYELSPSQKSVQAQRLSSAINTSFEERLKFGGSMGAYEALVGIRSICLNTASLIEDEAPKAALDLRAAAQASDPEAHSVSGTVGFELLGCFGVGMGAASEAQQLLCTYHRVHNKMEKDLSVLTGKPRTTLDARLNAYGEQQRALYSQQLAAAEAELAKYQAEAKAARKEKYFLGFIPKAWFR